MQGFWMNRKITIARQLLQGETVIVFPHGKSMNPLFREGDTYVVVKPGSEDLQVNDLALFRWGEHRYIIHRIIRITDEVYYTRGDNCIGTEKVLKKHVLGVVTEICRRGKIIKVTDKRYKLYVKVWQATSALRIAFLRIRAGGTCLWK